MAGLQIPSGLLSEKWGVPLVLAGGTALSGIGYLIARTAATYQVNRMFVPIVTLGLLGVTLTALLRLAEKYVAPWTNVADEN
jgi:NitT/TauT family transport system permease protein